MTEFIPDKLVNPEHVKIITLSDEHTKIALQICSKTYDSVEDAASVLREHHILDVPLMYRKDGETKILMAREIKPPLPNRPDYGAMVYDEKGNGAAWFPTMEEAWAYIEADDRELVAIFVESE